MCYKITEMWIYISRQKKLPNICLIIFVHSKDDVSAEAFKSLYGTTRKNEVDLGKDKSKSKIVMPLFEEITNYVYNEAESIVKNSTKSYNIGNHSLAFNLPVFVEVSKHVMYI